jgi:acyl carrier protein
MTSEATIRARIADFLGQPAERIDWRANPSDLANGSLMFVEVVVELQEEFGVRLFHEDVEHIACLEDLVRLLLEKLRGAALTVAG